MEGLQRSWRQVWFDKDDVEIDYGLLVELEGESLRELCSAAVLGAVLVRYGSVQCSAVRCSAVRRLRHELQGRAGG